MKARCNHEGQLYLYSADELRTLQAQLPRTLGAPVREVHECRRCGAIEISRRARPGFRTVEAYQSLAHARLGAPREVREVALPRYAQRNTADPVGISV